MSIIHDVNIYMKIIRICDVRKKVELRENISGSIALSKERFVFKNFNINTEQKIIFLSQSNRPRRGVLLKKNFNEKTRELDIKKLILYLMTYFIQIN